MIDEFSSGMAMVSLRLSVLIDEVEFLPASAPTVSPTATGATAARIVAGECFSESAWLLEFHRERSGRRS